MSEANYYHEPQHYRQAKSALFKDDDEEDEGAFHFDVEVTDASDLTSNSDVRFTIGIVPRSKEQSEAAIISVDDPVDLESEEMMDYLLDSGMGGCYGCESVTPSHALQSILKAPRRWIAGPEEEKANDDDDRSVGFKEITIKEFGMTLGDHPSATSGPPVRLDWDQEKEETKLDFEEYEQERQHTRRKRRDLKLSLSQRHRILVQERGLMFDEIKSEWRKALDIRAQRRETLSRSWIQNKWDEINESIWRKYSRLIGSLDSAFLLICY